jgi:hypothetical protein
MRLFVCLDATLQSSLANDAPGRSDEDWSRGGSGEQGVGSRSSLEPRRFGSRLAYRKRSDLGPGGGGRKAQLDGIQAKEAQGLPVDPPRGAGDQSVPSSFDHQHALEFLSDPLDLVSQVAVGGQGLGVPRSEDPLGPEIGGHPPPLRLSLGAQRLRWLRPSPRLGIGSTALSRSRR